MAKQLGLPYTHPPRRIPAEFNEVALILSCFPSDIYFNILSQFDKQAKFPASSCVVFSLFSNSPKGQRTFVLPIFHIYRTIIVLYVCLRIKKLTEKNLQKTMRRMFKTFQIHALFISRKIGVISAAYISVISFGDWRQPPCIHHSTISMKLPVM